MSRHWKPDGEIARVIPVRGRFSGPQSSRRWVFGLLGGAIVLGLVAGAALNWSGGRSEMAAPANIEWNAVQAVPTRTLDPEDIEWQRRAQEQDSASADSVPTDDSDEARPTRPSGARGGGIFVIDGDTFVMNGERIRVAGIDAPETHPPRCADEARLGVEAMQKLRDLLGSGTIRVSGTIHDKYGREVRQVLVGGRDVAEIMIGTGLARRYDGAQRQPWC
jgi:hypothetical protein